MKGNAPKIANASYHNKIVLIHKDTNYCLLRGTSSGDMRRFIIRNLEHFCNTEQAKEIIFKKATWISAF